MSCHLLSVHTAHAARLRSHRCDAPPYGAQSTWLQSHGQSACPVRSQCRAADHPQVRVGAEVSAELPTIRVRRSDHQSVAPRVSQIEAPQVYLPGRQAPALTVNLASTASLPRRCVGRSCLLNSASFATGLSAYDAERRRLVHRRVAQKAERSLMIVVDRFQLIMAAVGGGGRHEVVRCWRFWPPQVPSEGP